MMAYALFAYVPQFLVGTTNPETYKQKMAEVKEYTTDSRPARKILYPVRPKMNEKFGELIIPKLKAVLPIYEGTDEDALERGVGHYAKSVLPGESDNSVLSGHRDTVFRSIGKLKVGDELIVKTYAGVFTYRIKKTWIVDEDDRSVIVSHYGKKILTLTTCYPFNWIGPAPQRYIIQSEMVET